MRLPIFILFAASLLFVNDIYAKKCELCNAVDRSNFKKVEEIVAREVSKYKNGYRVSNGNNTYTNFSLVLDSLEIWFGKFDCVENVVWDKCQKKLDKIPYNYRIGVIFRTNHLHVEKVFTLQVRARRQKGDRLYYVGMAEQTGFVSEQNILCDLKTHKDKFSDTNKVSTKQKTAVTYQGDTINHSNLFGKYICIEKGIVDTLTFRKVSETGIIMSRSAKAAENGALNEEYWFRIVAPNSIYNIGIYSPWRIMVARITVVSRDIIEISYSNSHNFPENATVTFQYKKIEE